MRENATYYQIQKYVKTKYGKVVKTCWIAHAKEICGLNPTKSHRRIGSRVYPCPDEKLVWIKDAFKHFKMI